MSVWLNFLTNPVCEKLDTTPSGDDRQLPNLHHKPILKLTVPLHGIIPRWEAHLQLLHKVANDHPHLRQREVLAHTIRRAEREGNERIDVVYELLFCVRLFDSFGDEPAVGVPRVRMREVSLVALKRPKGHTSHVALGEIAAGTKESVHDGWNAVR